MAEPMSVRQVAIGSFLHEMAYKWLSVDSCVSVARS